MWEIRVLTGSQRGQKFLLSRGTYRVGRSPSCEVTLQHSQVSKEHACIQVYGDGIVISDMKSRNGTFVNGTQIQSHILKPQDQVVIYDIHLQIVPASAPANHDPGFGPTNAFNDFSENQASFHHASAHGSPRPDPHSDSHPGPSNSHLGSQPGPYPGPHPDFYPEGLGDEPLSGGQGSAASLLDKLHQYIEEVALPAIYKIPEIMEAKWAMGLFILGFATIVTFLSAVPALHLLKSNVEKEAEKRAVTIATAMVRENRNAIATQVQTALSVQAAANEAGVNRALIVSNPEGTIMAPASLAGQYASKTPFIYSAIKDPSQVVESIGDNLIGVSIPIKFYKPSTGEAHIVANAILIYDMSSIAIQNAQVTSLYIQIYALALLFGALLLFFIYKMTNHPIEGINKQLDEVLAGTLQEDATHIQSSYNLASLQRMVSNINSALSRMNQGDSPENSMGMEYDRSQELTHLVQLIGFGAIGITSHDLSVAAVNGEFQESTGMSAEELLYTPVENMTDQALKLSLQDLIERAQNPSDSMVSNELEVAGINYELVIQPIYGKASIAYYLIVMFPREGSEEGVA